MQAAREAELINNLRNRLAPYVMARKSSSLALLNVWTETQYIEARQLTRASLGAELVQAIGIAYGAYAHQSDGTLSRATQHVMTRLRETYGICSAVHSANKATRAEKKRDREARRRFFQFKQLASSESLVLEPVFNADIRMEQEFDEKLKPIYTFCLVDIWATIKDVCKAVIKEDQLPESDQKLRADALAQLSKIFQTVGLEAAANQAAVDKRRANDMPEEQHRRPRSTLRSTTSPSHPVSRLSVFELTGRERTSSAEAPVLMPTRKDSKRGRSPPSNCHVDLEEKHQPVRGRSLLTASYIIRNHPILR
eukprot:Blabericola_migrator_1__8124@NODE_4190_length_1288_cov_269_241605_g2595_i0_p1_GENE_NODE_4190_length_1288_cov_269_241605_g2595_i0NODE_4190_length_1288_cov_269_241605_g2595_i0_p1_ORF_typecomplete_len358_score58_25DnaJX/PF14308_6/3_4e21_NODE_4190_length_1288_cov_269_241605_g2595_i02141140